MYHKRCTGPHLPQSAGEGRTGWRLSRSGRCQVPNQIPKEGATDGTASNYESQRVSSTFLEAVQHLANLKWTGVGDTNAKDFGVAAAALAVWQFAFPCCAVALVGCRTTSTVRTAQD